MYSKMGKAAVMLLCAIAFATTNPTAAAADLKTGTYAGPATLKGGLGGSTEIEGRLSVEIKEIDDKGNVTAAVKASNGLVGDGTLKGSLDKDGSLKMKGKLTAKGAPLMAYDVSVKFKAKGTALTGGGTYELKSPGGSLVFDLKFEGEYKD